MQTQLRFTLALVLIVAVLSVAFVLPAAQELSLAAEMDPSPAPLAAEMDPSPGPLAGFGTSPSGAATVMQDMDPYGPLAAEMDPSPAPLN